MQFSQSWKATPLQKLYWLKKLLYESLLFYNGSLFSSLKGQFYPTILIINSWKIVTTSDDSKTWHRFSLGHVTSSYISNFHHSKFLSIITFLKICKPKYYKTLLLVPEICLSNSKNRWRWISCINLSKHELKNSFSFKKKLIIHFMHKFLIKDTYFTNNTWVQFLY